MKTINKSKIVKIIMVLCLFALLPLSNFQLAKAEVLTDAKKVDEFDWEAINSALVGRDIVDGDSFTVDGKYHIDCSVTMVPVINSKTASALSTSSTTYNAYCSVMISTQQSIATILHSINVTYYDTGLIHINSGSLSVNCSSSEWSGYTYGYQIVNTNGNYSYAYGVACINHSVDQSSAYYGCTANVMPTGDPSFSFTQM